MTSLPGKVLAPRRRNWTALVVLLGMVTTVSGAATERAILVENSRSLSVIVTGAQADPDEQQAALELSHYIHEATGARIPVSSGLGARTSIRILVGPSACPPEVQKKLRALEYEGYLIEARPDGAIILAGNGGQGTSFAVAEFLERYLGVRWLWPGDLGEVIPHVSSMHVPMPLRLQRAPAFLFRSLDVGGAVWGPLDKQGAQRKIGVPERNLRQQKLWEKRNRFGGVLIYGGHAFGEILPPSRYAAAHPEYYALVDGNRASGWQNFNGKHGMQPCTTNPDVIRITIDYCNEFFDTHPEYHALFISPNDGRGFCECDGCRTLDTGEAQTRVGMDHVERSNERVISDRMFTFANQVAEGVARRHPDKKLVMWAYSQYGRPPVRVRPTHNLIVSYCLRASQHWDPEVARADEASLEAWSRVSRNLGIYEYYRVADPSMPRLFPELIERSVRRLHELGYRYYQACNGDGYAIDGLNYYVLSKLLWDPSQSVVEIQRDFTEKGFGKAAPAISRYLDRMAGQWKMIQGKGVTMERLTLEEARNLAHTYLTKAFREASRRDLKEALQLTTGKERARVEFILKGFRYVDLTMDAVEKTIPLLEAGWVLQKPKAVPPAGSDMKTFREALEAWEAREAYIQQVQYDYVLDMWFVRYNDTFRRFNPLECMQNWVGPK